jgi:hypothetical protein
MTITTTAQRLITDAYRDSGLIAQTQTPNAGQLADGLSRLNDIINFEQTQGLKLFLFQDIEVPLTAGQNTYTLMTGGSVNITKPQNVVDGYFLDSNGVQRPIFSLSWNEWVRLSQVTQTGQINNYFVDKQFDRLVVKFWNVPDTTAATGTVHLIARVQASNLATVGANVAFPPEWFIFLRWALASDLAVGQPAEMISRCDQKKAEYKAALEAFDVEDASLQFQMDPRGAYPQGDFK